MSHSRFVLRCRPDVRVTMMIQSRRLYDCLISVLDQKGQEFGDIRLVLESGMRNGAVSLMKDVRE